MPVEVFNPGPRECIAPRLGADVLYRLALVREHEPLMLADLLGQRRRCRIVQRYRNALAAFCLIRVNPV